MIGSSQNARFEECEAARVARAIARGLGSSGLDVAAPAPWRGLGYRVVCRAGEHEIEITVEEGTLQIAPTITLTLGERLRTSRHPAAAACYRVATVVHLVLSECRCGPVRWRWDGPARDEDTPYPRTLSSIQPTMAT